MPRSEKAQGPAVSVVGGGISGMTAALRMAERGYRVTVYEQEPRIGGNMAALERNGAHYDVYTHMFSNFYRNFWNLAGGDLGLKRGVDFEPRTNVKILDQGRFPQFYQITDIGSFASAWSNLWCGAAPPADMYLWAYSMIDSLTKPFERQDDPIGMDDVSVTGFAVNRPYGTRPATLLNDVILMTIWSIQGFRASAEVWQYQRAVHHARRARGRFHRCRVRREGCSTTQPLNHER